MLFNLFLFILAAVALILSWRKDPEKTARALGIAKNTLVNLLPSLLGIIGLIGLMLTLLPREVISGFFGTNSLPGILVISLIGSITLIPAFIGFPLASSLVQAGASITAVACFITTVLMVGVITAPMEIEHFGARFTILRNLAGFVSALAIGIIMGVVLQ